MRIKTFIILHHPHCCYVNIPGTTCFAHSSCTSLFILIFIKFTVDCIAHFILFHCTFTPYFIFYFILLYIYFFLLFLSYSYLYLYIFSCVMFHFLFFLFFLHCPLSGPVLTYISLLIIPCMIVYVTNNKEPWTLNHMHTKVNFCVSIPRFSVFIWRTIYTHFHKTGLF